MVLDSLADASWTPLWARPLLSSGDTCRQRRVMGNKEGHESGSQCQSGTGTVSRVIQMCCLGKVARRASWRQCQGNRLR